MTSYSIWGNRMDSADPEEARYAQLETFLHGAARAVLDTAEPAEGEEGERIHAEMWHAPVLGWETDALDVTDLPAFRHRLSAFFDKHYDDLARVVGWLGSDGGRWGNTEGMGWYRAGMLYVYSARGEGTGFYEVSLPASVRLQEAAREEGGIAAQAAPSSSMESHFVTFLEL